MFVKHIGIFLDQHYFFPFYCCWHSIYYFVSYIVVTFELLCFLIYFLCESIFRVEYVQIGFHDLQFMPYCARFYTTFLVNLLRLRSQDHYFSQIFGGVKQGNHPLLLKRFSSNKSFLWLFNFKEMIGLSPG